VLGNKAFILFLEPFAEFSQTGTMKSTPPLVYGLNVVFIYYSGGAINSFQNLHRIGIRTVRPTSVTIIRI
jgi:hypothetical protein